MASPHTEQPSQIGGAVPRFSWKTTLVVLAILVTVGRVGDSGPEAGGERAPDGDGSGDP